MASQKLSHPMVPNGDFDRTDFAKGGLITGPLMPHNGPITNHNNPEVIVPLDKVNGLVLKCINHNMQLTRLRGERAADLIISAYLSKPGNG